MTAQFDVQPLTLTWRLAAVAFADVAGYSALVANDEEGTLKRWADVRETVLMPHLARNGGRVVDRAGDGIFAEFPGAIRAVTWAIDVQNTLAEHNRNLATRDTINLRIGINVDDVIDDDGALLSDGVNIAARIHQLGRPGEVVLTSIAAELIRNRMPVRLRSLGMPKLKNIDRPVMVFVAEKQQGSGPTAALVNPHLSWSTRPSIAILPFRTISGTMADRYFGEGITEDIIAGVARSRLFFVIARNSALQFGDLSERPTEVAHALGVKYLVTGSVRRHKNQLRINAELVEVDGLRTIWAERFDGATDELFDFQDRIVASVSAAIEPQVRAIETERIGNRPTESLDAYDCLLRGISVLYSFKPGSAQAASDLFQRAVELDPGYAQAHAYLAWSLNFLVGEGHSRDLPADRNKAVEEATLALEIDPDDAFCLTIRGHILALVERDPVAAKACLEQALAIDDNLPLAWAASAICHAYLGDGNEARERLRNVWRLTPYDPLNFFFWTAAGISEMVAGRFEEAAAWFLKSYRIKPQLVATLRMLAATPCTDGRSRFCAQDCRRTA
jgi:adenylate cyclase